MKHDDASLLNENILRKLEIELHLKNSALKGPENLSEFNAWDSLAIIMFIAKIGEEYHVSIDPVEIALAKTVQDLIDIVNSRLK